MRKIVIWNQSIGNNQLNIMVEQKFSFERSTKRLFDTFLHLCFFIHPSIYPSNPINPSIHLSNKSIHSFINPFNQFCVLSVKAPSQKGAKQAPEKTNKTAVTKSPQESKTSTSATSTDLDSTSSSAILLCPLINAQQRSPSSSSPGDEPTDTMPYDSKDLTLPGSGTNTISYDNPPEALTLQTSQETKLPGHNNNGGNEKTNTISYDNPPGALTSPSSGNQKASPTTASYASGDPTKLNTMSYDNPLGLPSASPRYGGKQYHGSNSKKKKKISQVGIVKNEVEPDVRPNSLPMTGSLNVCISNS